MRAAVLQGSGIDGIGIRDDVSTVMGDGFDVAFEAAGIPGTGSRVSQSWRGGTASRSVVVF